VRIAILGWGSLIPCPGELSTTGSWDANGPVLKIEFSRISADGRLTLVIDPDHGSDVTTQYAESTHLDIPAAIENLRQREGTTKANIGFCIAGENGSRHPQSLPPIRQWLNASNFEAVMWTDLESNFADKRHVTFSLDAAFDYLNSLENVCQANARDYINRAPEQTQTALRQGLQSRGWL
jgi:hypothetical protein